MPTTLAPPLVFPSVLDLTADAVRDRLVSELGTVGIPAAHWAIPTGNDCLGYLLWGAGIRDRDDFRTPLVKISAFLAVSGWQRVDADEVRANDIALCNWDGNPDADHVEWVYSIDRHADEVTTVSANTGPRPGVDIDLHPDQRGVWRKTRDLGPWLIGGVRMPFRSPVLDVTSRDRADVRLLASYLNRTVPEHYQGRLFPRSAAGTIAGRPGDGLRGPLYWGLVQLWGRLHGHYGGSFLLDRIPGTRTRYVERLGLAAAKAAR